MNRDSLISQVMAKIRTSLKPIAIAITRFLVPNSLQRLEQQQHQLRDWAQLSVYQPTKATIAPPIIEEHRVIFFGDSITEFWDLAADFPEKPYINRGISGQTTSQMLIRFRPDVIVLQPKAVLILGGTNDIAGNPGPMTLEMITNNYASMAELARANSTQVIFASVLPVHDYGKVKQSAFRSPTQIKALNDWLIRYCTEQQHIYLDYYSALSDASANLDAKLSDDGVHPNTQGYKKMASLASNAIDQALDSVSNST